MEQRYWRDPEVATPRVMARTTGALYLFGGLADFAALTSSPTPWPAVGVPMAAGVLSVLTAVLVWCFGDRLPRASYHLLVGAGTVLITLCLLAVADLATACVLAILYVLVAVDAYFFFARPLAALHVGVVLAACSVTLGSRFAGSTGLVIALDLVITIVAVVIGGLTRRASRASVDPLTELANRRGFDDALSELLRAAERTGQPLAAALFDVDHFKAVNDTRGHDAGDALLRNLAAHWRAGLPERGLLARLGGDEFALLLPGCTGPEALAAVEAVRQRFTEASISCGVTAYERGETASQLLRRTDRALYSAKDAGRGRSALDEAEASPLARELAAALAAGEIAVHFQHIVRLADEDVVGVEALARWHRPGLGPVSPAVFVEIAEAHGLIGELGRYVLRTACGELADLHRRTGRRLLLTVNVSGRELADPEYPAHVLDILGETGWPAAGLVLEVTESVTDADSPVALRTLEQLRAYGMAVAIDDFGTGYSSLSRLDTLPAQFLKLDHSFVAALTTSSRRASLMRSIVALAAALDLTLIAEGVETAEHADVLRALGCELAQGYYYSRPGPLAAELTLGESESRPSGALAVARP